MTDMWKIAIPLIKQFEGFVPSPYFCSSKKLTIGYGEVIHPEKEYGGVNGNILIQKADDILIDFKGSVSRANNKLKKIYPSLIKENEADAALKGIAQRKWLMIARSLPDGLTDNQCAAIISLVYNIGTGGFLGSTLFREIKKDKNNKTTISKQWVRWVYSDGKKNKGLIARRLKELEIYFS